MPIAAPQLKFRFGGIDRLYGPESLRRLGSARVCIIGIGGVGSWAVEALARSGIGRLTLVDLDEICESNINRQIHANSESIGRSKAEEMAKRCRQINESCQAKAENSFFTETTAESILETGFDYVVDAIDSAKHKCLLIAKCLEKGIPLIVSGAAGGRLDPTQIRVDDLALSYNDSLLARVRKNLRSQHGFPRQEGRRFKIPCVFSPEQAVYPEACNADEEASSRRLDCSGGYGAATHITGAFGFAAAAHVVKAIATSV